MLQWQNLEAMMETTWPTKVKRLIIWRLVKSLQTSGIKQGGFPRFTAFDIFWQNNSLRLVASCLVCYMKIG